MEYEQTVKLGEPVQYRFDLLKSSGDTLTIYGANGPTLRAAVSQHNRVYQCHISVQAVRGGAYCCHLMLERVRPVRVGQRQFYLVQLQRMEMGEIKIFPWHSGKGRTYHPIFRDLKIANKNGVQFICQPITEGIQVYRRKMQSA